MRRGTNLPAVGGYNRSVVLDAVRREAAGLSRTEIAERTGLSPQAVTNVSRRLLDAGLIRESGTVISGPGKPRTMLQLEPGGSFALGVHVDPAVVTYVLLDLHGTVVAHAQTPTPSASKLPMMKPTTSSPSSTTRGQAVVGFTYASAIECETGATYCSWPGFSVRLLAATTVAADRVSRRRSDMASG